MSVLTANTIAVDPSQPDAVQFIYDTCKKNSWKVDYFINNVNAEFGSHGDLNCTSGIITWQKPLMKLQLLFPKKMMLNFVCNQQVKGNAKK